VKLTHLREKAYSRYALSTIGRFGVVLSCDLIVSALPYLFLIISAGLILTLSVPACCLWMEISISIVLERKTLMKNEVNEDGRVAISTPV
jgi:hypothetical protein